jgi:hypothetical protein
LWGLALDSVIRHAVAGFLTLSLPGLWIKLTGFRRVFVWSFVLTYGKILLSAKSECLSRWGYKMSVLTLEDVVIEAATELAISGFCDVPVENKFGGVDLVPAGYYESRSFSNFLTTTFTHGVRFAIEDNVIHIYKAENFAIAASVSFKGSVSSSVLIAIAKEWLA